MQTEKPTYHTTHLGCFDFCGWAYYLEHIVEERELGNFYTTGGHGVHTARELNLRQKIKSGVDMDLTRMLDCARDEINRRVEEGYVDLQSEQLAGLSKSSAAGRIIDRTVKMVEIDRRNLQSTIQPTEVEVDRKVILTDWPFNIALRFDCLDTENYIDDCKTSKRKWTQEKSDSEYQPSIYTLGFRAYQKKDPTGFRHHCVICTPSGRVSAYPLITHRDDKQIVAVLERMLVMHESIKAGIFAPAHRSSWKCSPQWCRFYRHCKFVGK